MRLFSSNEKTSGIRLIACGWSLYILVESAKSEVGQTIGLCRLSPLLLEPDRPQKTMVCPTCFHQFSKAYT